MLFEGALSVTETKTASTPITLFCGVFFRMLGKTVDLTVIVGLAGSTIQDLLYFWKNLSASGFSSPQLWIIHGVCASVWLYLPEKIELALSASSRVSITNVRGPKPSPYNCLCLKHFSKMLSGKLFGLFNIWGGLSAGPFIPSVR